MRNSARLVVAAAIFSLAVWVNGADAALIAAGSIDGGGRVFSIDNDTTNTCGSPVVGPCQLPDSDPTVGSLIINGFGLGADVLVQATVQTADKATKAGTFNRLDSTGTQVTNIGKVSHHIQVAVSATDFVGPINTASATGAGQWSNLGGGFGNSNITMRWFDDPLNGQGALLTGPFQPGDLLALFSDVAGPGNPDSFSFNSGILGVNDGPLFSMTLQFEGDIAPGVRLTGREQTEIKPLAVPGPKAATLLFMGMALMGVGMLRGRKV